jgi:CubicO group peptidase (beta-lactamase class C family)
MSSRVRSLAALLAAAALSVPAGALAHDDTTPADATPPAATGQLPSYAKPSYSSDEDVVRGRIISFDGGYNLSVRDDRGFIDRVTLHPGTIINPTGLRLAPGMSVTVRGVNRGAALDANQIDTPYTTYGVVPVYPYAYPAYAYTYPAYGFGYGYGYGPTFSIGIGLGPAYGRRGGYGWGGGRWR